MRILTFIKSFFKKPIDNSDEGILWFLGKHRGRKKYRGRIKYRPGRVGYAIRPGFHSYGRILFPFRTPSSLPDKLVNEDEFNSRIPLDYEKIKQEASIEKPGQVILRMSGGDPIDLKEEVRQVVEWESKQNWKEHTWRSICEKFGIK